MSIAVTSTALATSTEEADAPPAHSRSWTRAGLPGPVVASAGVPVAESVTSVTALVIAFVPLWVWTERAAWGFAAAALAAAGLSYVLWARRVAVGENYLAVRQLGRYHVSRADAFRDVRLSPTQHGGTLRVSTDDGRCMRLRRAEYTDRGVNEALRSLCASGQASCDEAVEELLSMPQPSRPRFLADAVA
jgi:hypothetical protein